MTDNPEREPPDSAICEGPSGTSLSIRVVPRSGRTRLAGTRHGALLVRVAAAPVDGAANDVLLAYLADRLRVPKRQLRLVSGQRGRDKRVVVTDLSARDVAARLTTES